MEAGAGVETCELNELAVQLAESQQTSKGLDVLQTLELLQMKKALPLAMGGWLMMPSLVSRVSSR